MCDDIHFNSKSAATFSCDMDELTVGLARPIQGVSRLYHKDAYHKDLHQVMDFLQLTSPDWFQLPLILLILLQSSLLLT